MVKNAFIPKPCEILDVVKQSEIEYLFKVKLDNIDEVNYGQFLQVSVPMHGEAPISISDFNKEEGYVELLIRKVGKVTNSIFELKSQDKLFLRGPYGNGFDFSNFKDKNVIIVSGGSGLAPVRSLINHIYKNKTEVKNLELLMGFKNKEGILFKEDIEKWRKEFNVVLTLDNGEETKDNYIGLVTKHLDKLNLLKDKKDLEVIIVGPPMMMKFTAIEFDKLGINEKNMWLSFERKMSCALGKCGHCKINETYVCLEGPIFRYDKAKTLVD